MANNDNIKPHEFKKGQSGNPKGRPPKVLTAILKELQGEGFERVTNGQVVEAYEILFGLPEHKLKSVVADTEKPMILRIVAKSMLSTRGADMLEKMLDRAQGRPKQSIDADVTGAINVALVEFLESDNGSNTDQSTDTK